MEPRTDVDPDEVVAMGAAIHAASLLDEGADAFLLDVTPLSLQIGVAGGLAEPVIERNTPVPIEQTRTFTTFNDFQESVSIKVYQGESREASENEMLGHFEFGGFRKGKRGEVEIDVTFEINTDGIVNVTARDRGTGEAASTRITLSSGLSESEIQSIIERGVADRVETAKLENVAAPNNDDDELIPLPKPATRQAATPAAAKPAARPAAPKPAPAPAPKAAPVPAPKPAPKAVAPPPEPDLDLLEVDEPGLDPRKITTAVDEITEPDVQVGIAGEAVIDLSNDEGELDVSDIQGLDESVLPDGDSDSLFDKSGASDLADEES
jgi:hypothetical protein